MKHKFTIAILLLLTLLVAAEAQAQFLSNRGKIEDPYLNYAGRNYENYSSSFIRKKFFDNFGNFLIEGTSVFELNEVQRQIPATELSGGQSQVLKSRYYQNYFNNLVIGKDSYGGFQTRLMVGDAIRTKFTSLTFNRARFNGIRWDAGTPKYRGTFVASRISDPIRFRYDSGIYIDGVRRIRDWTQYLFGGHFETDFGDMLTVGFTYVNQHQRRSSLDSKEASLKGVVANVIPRIIFVRISDDSPGDNSGPVIYATPTVVINGQVRPTVNLYGKTPASGSTAFHKPVQYYVLRNLPSGEGFSINDKNYFAGADTTSYTSHTLYKDRYAVLPPSYPAQIPSSERENFTYAFIMPDDTAQSVQFQIILSNDYKIETAEDYVNILDDYVADNRFTSHAKDSVFATPTPFFVRKRAEGNVKDASNRQIVTIDYGLTSGMSVYGLNFNFKWQGFEIDGEFNQSVEYLKYPLLSGSRFENKGLAWFLRGKKKFGRLTLGGERYHIAPDYITNLNTYVLQNSYFINNSDAAIPNSPIPAAMTSPDFLGYDASFTYQRPVIFPGGAFYPLVDDNDDNDRWEDGFYFYNVKPTDINQRNYDVINRVGDFFKLGYRQSQNELQSLAAIIRQPDAGIFPGKDKDKDGIPDDDRNANGIPDFAEDFLTYYSDPPSLDFGDDWNNNGIIDEQENDILPDYPYEPDISGYHVFSSLELMDGLNMGIGKLHERAIARGGINDVNYLKTSYYTATPKFGSFRLYYVLKQVQDNIENNGYQFKGVITTADPIPDWVLDNLNYRNSLVNSIYVGTKLTQIRNLNIENNFRIEFNNQFKIGSRENAFLPEAKKLGDQVPGNVTYWGIVNKIDYTFSLMGGVLKLTPQFKVRTEKIIRNSENTSGKRFITVEKSQQEVIPIFRVDYRLTEFTDLRCGLQGFGFFGLSDVFKYKYRNFKDNVGNKNNGTFAASVSNRTSFAGYNVVFDFGYKYTTIDFLRPEDRTKGSAESSLFFTVYAGF